MSEPTENQETNVERFDREQGLDQESAASWNKRWKAQLADRNALPPLPTPEPAEKPVPPLYPEVHGLQAAFDEINRLFGKKP